MEKKKYNSPKVRLTNMEVSPLLTDSTLQMNLGGAGDDSNNSHKAKGGDPMTFDW